jgi:Putative transposase/Transposase zinc-binding domain
MVILLYLDTAYATTPGRLDNGAGRVAEASPVYRPRHPEWTPFYRLFEHHFDRYLMEYEYRYEPRYGYLRPVVPRTVSAFLECGRLQNGFARIRCPQCRGEHLLAFSCQTRNFCPSCQAKRAALVAEKMHATILAPVPHRHLIFTIPKVLRGLFQRERRLLSILTRSAYDAVRKTWATGFEDRHALPGLVISIQTFGSFANWHPHLHAMATNGVMTRDGDFRELPRWTSHAVEEVFRRLVLHRLVKAERLSEEFRDNLLAWVHSGFSVHGDRVVWPEETVAMERLARYMLRAPVPLEAVAWDGDKVRVKTPADPKTGERDLLLDPLDWIHAVTLQVPDPRLHMVRYYGLYANRSRRLWQGRARNLSWGSPASKGADPPPVEDSPRCDTPGSRSGSWARLLRRILEVDPLLCPRCGVEMRIVSVITEPKVVDQILRSLSRGACRDPFAGRAPPVVAGIS